MNSAQIKKLVDKAKHYDREAFAQLYDYYYERIYKYIYFKIGDVNMAEDLASQTFTGALKSIVNFNWRGSSFASWLFRIANNVVVDYYRRSSNKATEPLSETAAVTADDNPAVEVEKLLSYEKVNAALAGLPRLQQQVIIYKFIVGLTNNETAEILGKSEGAVKSLQFRAIAALRRLLDGEL